MALADRKWVPCPSGAPPLKGSALEALRRELDPAWRVVSEHHLERDYRFPDFGRAFAFVARVADLAEALNHHPEIQLGWGRVRLTIWTHAIDGLAEGDFVFAAKADRLRGDA